MTKIKRIFFLILTALILDQRSIVNAQTGNRDALAKFISSLSMAIYPPPNKSNYNSFYTLTYSEEVFLLLQAHGTPQSRFPQSRKKQQSSGCVMIPSPRQDDAPNKGPDAQGELVCGAEAIRSFIMPPTRSPIPFEGIQPDFVVPRDGLTMVNCDEEYWDCDDTAWAYCKLLPEAEQANCHITFLFTRGWHHALNTQRSLRTDGTWEVCLIEPSIGAAIHCWISTDGSLEVPDEYYDEASSALCAYYKNMGLNCDDWLVSLFFRLRYLDPSEGWSSWYCGEAPWWQCGNDDAINAICEELKHEGIDPCTIAGDCSAFCTGKKPGSLASKLDLKVQEYPGYRRQGEL